MLGNGISPTSLAFNCGFAQVAVRELTETQRGQPQSIDKEKRAHGFKELFERPSFLYQVNTSVTEGLHESLVSTRTARRLSEASQRNETHREKHVNTIWRSSQLKHGIASMNKRRPSIPFQNAKRVQQNTKVRKSHFH